MIRSALKYWRRNFTKNRNPGGERKAYEPGQWVYGVEYDGTDLDKAGTAGCLFMAECGDYVIGAPEYANCIGNFKEQLKEMYEDSANGYSVNLYMLRKELTFPTLEEAGEKLMELVKQEG